MVACDPPIIFYIKIYDIFFRTSYLIKLFVYLFNINTVNAFRSKSRAQEEDACLLNCFVETTVDVRGNRKIDFGFINYFALFD
jgi:hypothetical protein